MQLVAVVTARTNCTIKKLVTHAFVVLAPLDLGEDIGMGADAAWHTYDAARRKSASKDWTKRRYHGALGGGDNDSGLLDGSRSNDNSFPGRGGRRSGGDGNARSRPGNERHLLYRM